MKKIRNIPFGYMMVKGRYIAEPSEYEAVIQIFRMYLSGMSLKDIADVMTVPYSKDKPLWTLNMVKRIIENEKYTGKAEYPQLIERHAYEEVRRIADERRKRVKGADTVTKMLRSLIKGSKPRIKAGMLKAAITQIISSLIADPSLADPKGNFEYSPSAKTIAADDRITLLMQDPDADIGQLEKLILEAASLRYADCPYDNRDKTIPLKGLLECREPTAELDIDLVQKVVKHIIVENGVISAELVNGAIISSQGE